MPAIRAPDGVGFRGIGALTPSFEFVQFRKVFAISWACSFAAIERAARLRVEAFCGHGVLRK